MSENSCIETPAAPEWLSKLENRREMLKHSKLGHEAGAGAPCVVCGDKCPGLDLHFWRKVCRNCKCRKDQHMCSDDDTSGWAQFEILGQIRSKPAFIKIKALASQPVQLEWVPPNAAPDVITDYMEKLGAKQIPVAGSEAALKRKQQLEFQVPPHDLDAQLCDNLSETEANQLQLYVQRIRENCVGQGNVVRVGNINHARVGVIEEQQALELTNAALADPILGELLANEKLQNALKPNYTTVTPTLFVAFNTPICETFDGTLMPLKALTKQKLRGLNSQAVQSVLQHAAIYDKIFAVLSQRQLNVSRDPRLGPLADFHDAYKQDEKLRQDVQDNLLNKANEFIFNSPLPLKSTTQARLSAQMQQDTPMRRVRLFGNVPQLLQAPMEQIKDAFLTNLLKSTPLKQALLTDEVNKQPLVLINTPFKTADQLLELGVPVQGINEAALKSLLLNPDYYDTLFENLNNKKVEFSACKALAPLQELHLWLQNNPVQRAQLQKWALKQTDLPKSNSNDSGFDSKPSTPKNSLGLELPASAGRFTSIPGIEELNMYPSVQPKTVHGGTDLPEMLQQLQLSSGAPNSPIMELNCSDCQLPIRLGEVAVKAARADRGMAWHPDCFKCYTCRELLADLVYFFHNGQVYCGRDLAIKLKIPRCKACDELIFTKEYTAAEGASFHIKHFCCYHCDTPLAGQQYVPDEKTNMPLCLKCYEEYFAAYCQLCKQAIGPTDQGVALGDIHWHGSCFICAGVHCGKSLIGGRFCIKEKMPFCSANCIRSIIH